MKHNQKQSPTPTISRQYSLHDQQRGVATVLLVILLGFTVMVMTATLARTVNSKKEATVAAHAQTNAQLMAWAGVSAFQQYLKNQGALGVQYIKGTPGLPPTLVLKRNANQEIFAKNITVTDACSVNGDTCTVSADISAKNIAAQAATTVNVTFTMRIINGSVTLERTIGTFNLGGDTIFSANTTIAAESPNSEVVINANGKLTLNLGFKLQNISTLTINATDDVYLDCGGNKCGNTKININSAGNVSLVNGNNFGDIVSAKDVRLNVGAYADNIKAAGLVYLTSSGVRGNIESQRYVHLTDTQVGGSVKAYDYIILDTNSTITRDAYANGYNRLVGNNVIRLSTSDILGTVYADGDIYPMGLTERVGNAYITGSVVNFAVLGTRKEDLSLNSTYLQGKIPFTITLPSTPSSDTLSTPVDVTKYKSEANYIFTNANMVNRVFLNKLKNKANGITYNYINGQQTAIDSNNQSVSLPTNVQANGFALGYYKIGSNTYRGAVCAVIDANHLCTSEIIGYLPRISVELDTANSFFLAAENNASDGTTNGTTNYGATDDYAYYYLSPSSQWWRIRTITHQAAFENAALAPGIMYFEGDVELAGGSLAPNSYLINTLLAEGKIIAIAFSPVVYSPYNAVRNNGTVGLVCNRKLKDINGTALNISATTPTTLSDTYLIPTNLCADAANFAYNMNKDANGNIVKLTIDNKQVDKLDLGKVALMANNDIRIGSCANIYGDVLTRGRLDVSTTGSCGTGASQNAIVGEITTQAGTTNGNANNDQAAGAYFKVPTASANSGSTTVVSTTSGLSIDPATFRMVWSRSL